MSDTSPDSAPSPSGSGSSATEESAWKRWSVLLPALTFLVGLALGAAVIGVAQSTDEGVEGPEALASPGAAAPSPTPTSGDLNVTIPASCVEAAEKAEFAYDVLQDAASAVRDLDARRLAEVVDLAQTEQAEVDRLISACREAAGSSLLEPDPSTAVVPTPTQS